MKLLLIKDIMTTDIKYFTPSEARKTLPLVKNIVKDMAKMKKYIEDDVRVSYSIVKQRESLKNFIDSLIVQKNVEIF